mmetsp:Transcript_14470/g.31400  ORF Transcript_14470/g.31400 Transcript_14470/m.31400 type:complete len:517 (+) Transcript_14470:56-1606(+)
MLLRQAARPWHRSKWTNHFYQEPSLSSKPAAHSKVTKNLAEMDKSKRRRIEGTGSPIHSLVDNTEVFLQHSSGQSFKVPGLICTDHYFTTCLDYSGEVPGEIQLFVREVVSPNQAKRGLPYLLFLQGGPGFESPRPTEASAWLKSAVNSFRVILMDQRGTGRSSQITVKNLAKQGTAAEQAQYLSFFRADNIVRDAEVVRKSLVPKDNYNGKWSILGQSFGGFCATTYMSTAPEGLIEVMMTGGIPPVVQEACSAEAVYTALYRRVLLQNQKYYERFPQDIAVVQRIVSFLAAQPGGGVRLPSGTLLTPRAFQLLGLSGLGSGGGFERLHYLLETFFDVDDQVNPTFIKQFESWQSWDVNPLYALLHESIYCQGPASAWAAHRVREDKFRQEFDAVEATVNGRPVMFTGEMVFPWMFDDFAALQPYKEVAELLASKADWAPLYDAKALQSNKVPVAAAVYVEDMYVDYHLSQVTASSIRGIRQWITNEYKHSGIRDDGARIFDRLLNMVRDAILVE